MNHSDIYVQQRKIATAVRQAERARTEGEAQAESQRRMATDTIKQNADAEKERVSTLLQSVHSTQEAARAELQRVSLSRLEGGAPLATSGLHAGNPSVEFERTGSALQEAAIQLSALVAALLKHRADAKADARRLANILPVIVMGGLIGLVATLMFLGQVNDRGGLGGSCSLLLFGYVGVWLGLIIWLSKK